MAGIFGRLSKLFKFGGGGTCVGLNIGSSSVKIAELKKTSKGWQLLHLGIVQLPEDALVNREIVNATAVVDAIKTLTSQMNLKTKEVCSSISGAGVIIKKMSLDVPNAKDLRDQVFWEAEQYLPFEISEVVMDYQILNNAKEGHVEVLLVAVKKSVLQGYIDVIAAAGLTVKVVDVDFFCLQNAFEANYTSQLGEAVGVIDVGANSTKMVVIQNGIPVFTKDSSIGGMNLTADIQKHLNLGYADAEMLKTGSQSNAMPQEVSELMSVASENLAMDIKRSLDFYNASASGAQPSYLLLSGGACRLPEFSKIVEEKTGIPVQLLNPFNNIQFDPAVFSPEYMAANSAQASLPVGLAIRSGGAD